MKGSNGLGDAAKLCKYINLKLPSIRILLFLFLHLLASNSFATSYITNLTSEDGLYQTTVNAISSDNRGFLIFGTQDGLLSYDGFTFDTIRNQKSEYSSLASNHITSIQRDSKGILWIGTTRGLHTFDGNSNQLLRIDSSFEEAIITLFIDNRETLWIGSSTKGLFKLDSETLEIKKFQNSLLNTQSIAQISQLNKQSLLVSSWQKVLFKIELNSESISTQSIDKDDFEAGAMFVLDDGQVLVANEKSSGVKILDTLGKPSLDLSRLAASLENEKVEKILQDKNKNLWIGTESGTGLIRYNVNSGKIKKYHVNANGKSLINDHVWSIFADDSNNIWVGTNSGITKLSQTKALFGHLPSSLNPSDIQNPIITAVFEDRSQVLWVGTYGGGVYRYEEQLSEFTKIQFNSIGENEHSEYVIALNQDEAGNILIGTISGMHLVDSKTLEEVSNQKFKSLVNLRILDIKIDDINNIWVNTDEGVYVYQLSNNQSCNMSRVFGEISHVYKHGKLIWLTKNNSSGELYQIDPFELDCNSTNTEKLNIKNVAKFKPLLTDSNGNIWVRVAEGLLKLSPNLNLQSTYTERNGLTNGTVHDVLEDNSGALWITTNHGLTKLEDGDVFSHYFERDGLQSNEFNGEASLKRQSGKLVLGGMNGLNIFDPLKIEPNNTLANPHISSITLFNDEKNMTISEFERAGAYQIDVDPSFSGVEIEFIGLHFQDPELNKYEYRLNGYETKWNRADFQKRYARYTNLPYGDYTFELRVSNSNNLWSPINDSLKFHFITPWYFTWWASLIGAVGLMAFMYFLIKWRLYSLRQANKFLEQQVKARTASIAEQKQTIEKQVIELQALDKAKDKLFENISHEFRTPLTLIIGPLKRLYAQDENNEIKTKLDVPIRQSSRLLRLINQFLEIAKLNSGTLTLNKRNYHLSDQIRHVVYSFQDLLDQKNIKLRLKLDDEIVLFYDASAMEKILVNLLSNAINYSNADTEILISAEMTNPTTQTSSPIVKIKVKDQGVGISEQALPHIFDRFNTEENHAEYTQGIGVGLALVKDLVALHDGNIHVQSELGVGSCFTISIPVVKKDQELSRFEALDEHSPAELEKTINKDFEIDSSDTGNAHNERGHELLRRAQQTILIVDDEPDMRTYISELLSDYQLLIAKNGVEALEIAKEYIPDLIVSDVMMPLMDGLELVKSIKEHVNTSHIPMILLTAKGSRDNKLDGLREGVDDYIVKPFDETELVLRISNILDIRKELIENNRSHTVLNKSTATSHLPKIEEKFINQLNQFLAENYLKEDLSVNDIADAMFLEKRQLQRKLRGLLDTTPSDYLRTFRLQEAALLLQQGESVNVAFERSGFANLSHFSRCFKAAYNVSPSQYFSHLQKQMSQSENS